MSMKTGVSSSAQCLRVAGETPSGPGALRVFCLLNYFLASCSGTERAVGEEWESRLGLARVSTVVMEVGEGREV